MSTKVKRKVTVENNKDNADQHRRPSVFERLGPGAVSVGNTQQKEQHKRQESLEKCRNWQRSGSCVYGNACRYQHNPFPNSSSRRNKSEKEIPEKDLRHKVRNKRDENKESRTCSLSPKRKGSKRSGSRSRKGEHESKIKSTVVVTRPRSPAAKNAEPQEREKKKIDGTWEDDSDDWPLDSAQLDYKEELTLERKRQQLQRELELEYQKERMMNESVTITKTVSFSESSSSSSSSESGSISTTSESSSSSSDDDSDDSSSSSSSSSSSASRPPKKKSKKPPSGKDAEISVESSAHQKPRDDYDKIKSSRAAKIGIPSRSPIPSPEPKSRKKGRDRRTTTPPPVSSPKHSRFSQEPSGSGRVKSRVKGPHTPSPPHSRKQRQWEQSSSADSRSADARQSRGKRHKKKRDAPRNEAYKSERAPTPPELSSPNRTALIPNSQFSKKSRQKVEDVGSKSRQRNRGSPPLLLSRMSGHSNSPSARASSGHGNQSLERDRSAETSVERSKIHMRKPMEDNLSQSKRSDSREQMSKRSRFSPRRDGYRENLSPPRVKMEGDGFLGSNSRKPYTSPVLHLDKGDDRNDRRRRSPSPARGAKDPRDRRSFPGEFDKKRELREPSPRPGRDNLHRNVDSRNYPRKDSDIVGKRGISPDIKKGREDKVRDRGPRDRNIEHDPLLWNEDHKKAPRSNSANRPGDARGWQDVQQLPPNSRGDRPRDKERDRKKGKERDLPHRAVEEGDKPRLPSPIRGRSPLHGHHPIPEVDAPLPSQRGRLYEPDIPPGEREYAYGYDAHRDPLYVNDRLMPPEYEPDLIRGPPVYGPEGYPEGARYRRDPPLKEQGPLSRGERVGGYNTRDGVSARDMLPSRDIERRNDDYLPDVPIDERHAYDERWGRNRPMRDEWDPYGGLPPSAHPPAPSLDEDRYGMPRRRRASPEWQLRSDDRELPLSPANHRQGNHPPLPSTQRADQRNSRSPPPKRIGDSSRGSWNEHPGRNSSRSSDNRHDLQQKNQDDRKGRNGRRDHRDRSRRRDGAPVPENKALLNKDKPNAKRPRSPSPIPKDCKKRKEEIPPLDTPPVIDKNLAVTKRPREEPKLERKPPVIVPAAKLKVEPPSPKGNTNSRSSIVQEKVDTTPKISPGPGKALLKLPEKEEKKIKRVFPVKKETTQCRPEDLLKRYGMIDDKSQGDDDFSDWSDGDDDLLNRDDFNEVDIGDDFDKAKNKTDDLHDKPKKDGTPEVSRPTDSNCKAVAEQLESAKQKPKELLPQSSSKEESKEKTSEDVVPPNKEKEPIQELKEYEAIDSFMVKDETDTDDYITTECVDYDPISDDELEALIEEPDDQTIVKQDEKNENSGIVDALDVNWSTLMSESRTKADFVPGFARKRFKTAHVLSRTGFSQNLAGSEMTKKILEFCQEQLNKELAEENQDCENSAVEEQKFVMEHHIAAFHVAISEGKKERAGAFSHLGPNRRALCARKDLQIRKLLCQPLNKLVDQAPATYRQQSNVDKDLYKKSLELLNLRKAEYQARTVDVY